MVYLSGSPLYNYHPAYNDVTYVIDSTNKTLQGFRYVFDIYSAGTSTLLASFDDVPPTGEYGYGIQHIDATLSDYLTYTKTGLTASDSWIRYNVEFGEKTQGIWTYDDFEFFSSTGVTNARIHLRQFASATTHSYVAGNQINVIQQDIPCAPEGINGLHTVIFVPSPYSVVLEVPYLQVVGPGACAASGTTTFADNRPTITRGIASISGQTAFNGYTEFDEVHFNSNNYKMTGQTGVQKFLTSCPNEIRMGRDCDAYFNIISDFSNQPRYLYITTDDDEAFSINLGSTPQNAPIIQLAVGPNNIETGSITPQFGSTLPIIKDATTQYTIAVMQSPTSNRVSEKFVIKIDDRCAISYPEGPLVLQFLDRLGSIGSFEMKGRMKVMNTNEKKKFTKQTGYFDIIRKTWTHNIDERGITTVSAMKDRSIDLHTLTLTEEEAAYFDEAYDSGFVWLKWNGNYMAVDVQDTNYESNKTENKNIITKKITVKFSTTQKINV